MDCSMLYIFIGAVPHTEALAGFVERDENGFILTGQDLIHDERKSPKGWYLERSPLLLETNVPGILPLEMYVMVLRKEWLQVLGKDL